MYKKVKSKPQNWTISGMNKGPSFDPGKFLPKHIQEIISKKHLGRDANYGIDANQKAVDGIVIMPNG